jgi:hypothetical protein
MDEIIPLPSYEDAQKIRLMEWVHKAFFDGWWIKISLASLLAEALEFFQSSDEIYRKVGLEDPTSSPIVWDGSIDDFLIHLYYARIPGMVPFDCSQTVRRYVEVSFGTDALEYLDGTVKKEYSDDRRGTEKKNEDLQNFGNYLAACGFHSKRLKRFRLPVELEILAAAALAHPAYPAPTPLPTPAPTPSPAPTAPPVPVKNLPAGSQDELF